MNTKPPGAKQSRDPSLRGTIIAIVVVILGVFTLGFIEGITDGDDDSADATSSRKSERQDSCEDRGGRWVGMGSGWTSYDPRDPGDSSAECVYDNALEDYERWRAEESQRQSEYWEQREDARYDPGDYYREP